ncbi:amino acid ABC transporter permease [Actinosynnema pretiosum subsp. pretiosum]|uniref:Polar amino acid ABC transporter, inner membrane subunit n=2 Tax=Actinosynnema TaxID=40566 RepID=C6WSB0_ACTMD|nr:amino acid ABC transporter permease [Actinosynnema mirum]ACU40780.1 polar amino acid ABC transporter, inner membrane subunit [Actinosynnema mirum DSM 43827]AXX34287.1 polar amino acid ABC transporter, inner membrane subunit [Actinosynnema pretiosum subsp. pretiosum]QUF02004.1 amino acid ABC transporter permease [Actinosynnema pretiosum subsp. pretiosum]
MALSKRQRAKVFRGAQYALLVVIAALIAVVADWEAIRKSFFDVETAKEMFPEVITTALVNTVVYTALGFAVGLVAGLVLALMKLSSVGPYRWIATIYIEFFRGVPALLVFVALSVAVPLAFGLKFDIYSTAAIALGVVGAAYIAETIRAGIKAVPKGQLEAARSLGMSQGRTTVTVVIPQAFRIILPPLTNELIMLTKDSSLISIIGLIATQRELTKYGREVLSQSPTVTPLLIAGLCYLIITLPLGYLSRWMETRGAGGSRSKKVSSPESKGLGVSA